MKDWKLVLGSQSPRRKELLTKAGFEFDLRPIETDESFPLSLPKSEIAEHIARKKADAHLGSLKNNELLITADTIVVYQEKVFGKPQNVEEAVQTILMLSNTEHQVYSGVCLMSVEKTISFSELSHVKFGQITSEEAAKYVADFMPLDKAGSYGIQDWIGYARIEWIRGSYTNILGLPLSQVYDAIKQF